MGKRQRELGARATSVHPDARLEIPRDYWTDSKIVDFLRAQKLSKIVDFLRAEKLASIFSCTDKKFAATGHLLAKACKWRTRKDEKRRKKRIVVSSLSLPLVIASHWYRGECASVSRRIGFHFLLLRRVRGILSLRIFKRLLRKTSPHSNDAHIQHDDKVCFAAGFLLAIYTLTNVDLFDALFLFPLHSFLLAFCTSFPMLISARVLAGLANGSFVAHKALISDISDSTTVAVGFCFYVLGWCLSSLLGSAVGGLLSEPAIKYPSSGIFLYGCHVETFRL